MDLLIQLAIVWICLVVICEGYFISSCNATAKHATELCELAKPNITHTESVPTVEAFNVTVDRPLWVGFVKRYHAFTYLGCVEANNKIGPGHTTEPADPAGCHSRCKVPHIGLQWINRFQKNCYCFNAVPKPMKQCTSSNLSEELFCGDALHVSVYMKVGPVSSIQHSSPLSENITQRHCLAYEPSSTGYYFWSTCSNAFRFLCRHNNGDLKYTQPTYGNWMDSMLKCVKPSMPVDYSTNISSIASNVGGQFWIANIRSYIIVEEYEKEAMPYIQRGYIKYDDSFSGPGVRLQFGIDQRFHALCILGDNSSRCNNTTVSTAQPTNNISTTTTTPRSNATTYRIVPTNTTTRTTSTNSYSTTISSTTTTTTTSTASAPTAPPATSETSLKTPQAYTNATNTGSSIHATGSNIQSTTTRFNQTESEGNVGKIKQSEEKQNLVAVFVVIPLVLLIAAAVIAFIIYRKRKSKRDKNEDSADYHGVEQSKKNTKNAIVNASYQCDIPINPPERKEPQHDYLVLEPFSEYAAINDMDLDNADTGEYNTTNQLKMNDVDDGDDTGNVYNKLNDAKEDTYNHTNSLTKKEDSTYNHAGHDGANATYNTTATFPHPKENAQVTTNEYNQPDRSNDTYNHLGDTLQRADNVVDQEETDTKRDNTMGDPKQVAYAYAYAKPLPKRPLPSPGVGKQKYDYAYATTSDGNDTSKRQVVFNFDHAPTTGGYELAKDVATGGSYELAKPPGDYELAKPPGT